MRKSSRHPTKPKNKEAQRARDQAALSQELRPVQDQLHTSITLRFVTQTPIVAAGGVVQMSFQNLLDAWLIAGTATNGYQLFDMVKIRRVSIRAGVQIGGSGATQVPSCTVGIEYPGIVTGYTGSGKQVSDTSMSAFTPAYASLTPGRDTLCGKWQASSGNTAVVCRVTDAAGNGMVGAIIDVDLSYKNSGDVNPAAVASAIAGATAGELYFGGADGGRLAATTARSTFIRRI